MTRRRWQLKTFYREKLWRQKSYFVTNASNENFNVLDKLNTSLEDKKNHNDDYQEDKDKK